MKDARLPGAAMMSAVRAFAAGPRLSGVKFLGCIVGSGLKLLFVSYEDRRMAAVLGDVAHHGDDFAAKVGEVADARAVARQGHHLKRAFVAAAAGAEREMGVAAFRGGDAEDLSGDASMLAGQLRGARGGSAFDAQRGKGCVSTGCRWRGGGLGWSRVRQRG